MGVPTIRHIHVARLLIVALTFSLSSFMGCQQPYSPAVYRQQSQSQQYAIICHNDKQTLRMPAEEWKVHKAHGDYRGPCRPTKPAGKSKPEEVKHTAISYNKAKPRAAESHAQWAERQAIKDAYIDSLKTAMQEAPARKQ